MQSIDNSQILNYPAQRDNTLVSAVAFSLNNGTGVLSLTDNSTYASGDGRKIVQVLVADKFGKKKEYTIASNATDNKIDINLGTDGFNRADGVDVAVTVVSNKGKVKDGSIKDVGAWKLTGNLVMEK